MALYITKSSGERERFSAHKFIRSLRRSGASRATVEQALQEVFRRKPTTTQEIHDITTRVLQSYDLPVADRYNLKRALMALGPEGYPFEKFIGQLFTHLGYQTETSVIIAGACVDHEVDVLAKNKDQHVMVECKFHNRPGLKTDVKVSLYVQARFEDVNDAANEDSSHRNHTKHRACIVTNTQFTSEAIKYAACKNIQLIGWAYPREDNIAQLVEKFQLFPVTTLTSLKRSQQRLFMQEGIVLCSDILNRAKDLTRLGISPRNISRIQAEAEAVCSLKQRADDKRNSRRK